MEPTIPNDMMRWPSENDPQVELIGEDTPSHPGTTTDGYDHEHNLGGTCFGCIEKIGGENPGALDGIAWG